MQILGKLRYFHEVRYFIAFFVFYCYFHKLRYFIAFIYIFVKLSQEHWFLLNLCQ